MCIDNDFKISKIGNSYILYDVSIIAEPTLQLFDRDYHTNQSSRQNKLVSNFSSEKQAGIGRAPVVYF
jgi:hypothetical protein